MNTIIDIDRSISLNDLPHERVPREVSERFESYRNDPDLLELAARLADERGIDIPDPTESEESFMAALQTSFDFRQGKKREELEGGNLSENVKELAEKLVDKYDMRRNTEPKDPDADAAFVLGGAGITPLTRLEYLMNLMEQDKLRTPRIVMVGGERPVDEAEIARVKLGELARTGVDFDLSGKPVTTEFDLMRETAAYKLGIADDEWEHFEGDDPSVPHGEGFLTTWRVARAYKDGREILVTSAPMVDDDRYLPNGQPRNRANTADSLIFVTRFLRMGKVGVGKIVTDTNAAFVPFQHADAERALAGYDVDVETVGMTREYSGLSEWQNGDIGYYIQELLSAIRSTRAARDRLNVES